jgi:hypothetical protein
MHLSASAKDNVQKLKEGFTVFEASHQEKLTISPAARNVLL